jgi:hypothetical protein
MSNKKMETDIDEEVEVVIKVKVEDEEILVEDTTEDAAIALIFGKMIISTQTAQSKI